MDRAYEVVTKTSWPEGKARVTIAKDRVSFKHSSATSTEALNAQQKFIDTVVSTLGDEPYTLRGEVISSGAGMTLTLYSQHTGRGKRRVLRWVFQHSEIY